MTTHLREAPEKAREFANWRSRPHTACGKRIDGSGVPGDVDPVSVVEADPDCKVCRKSAAARAPAADLNSTARAVADTLRALMPDRGNRYAPRSVRTKGEAQAHLWRATCRALASELSLVPSAQRAAFLRECGLEEV